MARSLAAMACKVPAELRGCAVGLTDGCAIRSAPPCRSPAVRGERARAAGSGHDVRPPPTRPRRPTSFRRAPSSSSRAPRGSSGRLVSSRQTPRASACRAAGGEAGVDARVVGTIIARAVSGGGGGAGANNTVLAPPSPSYGASTSRASQFSSRARAVVLFRPCRSCA